MPDSARLNIPAAEASILRSTLESAVVSFKNAEDREAHTLLERFASELPSRLRSFIVEFRERKDIAYAVVSGFRVGVNVGPTPRHWSEAGYYSRTKVEDFFLLLCASRLGEPFAWPTQQGGEGDTQHCSDSWA